MLGVARLHVLQRALAPRTGARQEVRADINREALALGVNLALLPRRFINDSLRRRITITNPVLARRRANNGIMPRRLKAL